MIIINERNLPEESRTIPPMKLGGYAGGEKYFRGGIIFKFAIDQIQGNTWMYGGMEDTFRFFFPLEKNIIFGFILFLPFFKFNFWFLSF